MDVRDPNMLARELADLRDELEAERAAHEATREAAGFSDTHRALLGVVAEEARKLAQAVGRLMDRWSEASTEVRTNDLWRPMGQALCHLEEWLDKLDDEERS